VEYLLLGLGDRGQVIAAIGPKIGKAGRDLGLDM
jgi:hypothetical protein